MSLGVHVDYTCSTGGGEVASWLFNVLYMWRHTDGGLKKSVRRTEEEVWPTHAFLGMLPLFLVINAMWPCQLILKYNIIRTSLTRWASACDVLWQYVQRKGSYGKKHALRPRPLDPEINRVYPWLMGRLHAKIRDCRFKEKADICQKPDERQTNTVIPVYPQSFVEGYNYEQEN